MLGIVTLGLSVASATLCLLAVSATLGMLLGRVTLCYWLGSATLRFNIDFIILNPTYYESSYILL